MAIIRLYARASNIIEMVEVDGIWMSMETLPKIVSETKRKQPGIKLSTRGWDGGHVRKGWQYTYSGATIHEVPASPIPATFEAWASWHVRQSPAANGAWFAPATSSFMRSP